MAAVGCAMAPAATASAPILMICVPYHHHQSARHRLAVSPSILGLKKAGDSSSGRAQRLMLSVSRGLGSIPCLKHSAASRPFLGNEPSYLPTITPLLSKRNRSITIPKAFEGFQFNFKYPVMTRKPRWWWRFLAVLPYMLPFHETWVHAETSYHVMAFFEYFECITTPFFESLGTLPIWVFFLYFISAYLLIVRRKELPHFFRFHVCMGLLVEIGLHAIGHAWKVLPQGLYWGKIGAYFWTAFAYAHMLTCIECMRCALSGMYADVPLISDAAYMQLPVE